MLELLVVTLLLNKNKANASARGRKPGGFILLTVLLWFGLEIIGGVIGYAVGLELGAYALALVFAAIGGLVSYLAAKNCKPGSYVPPAQAMAESILQNAQPLSAPAQVDIIRESSMVGAVVSWSFTLNGQSVGSLSNGKAMSVFTGQRQNVLLARDAYGTQIAPYVFEAESGGHVGIHFKAGRFLQPQTADALAPVAQASAQTAQVFHTQGDRQESAAFCPCCGTAFHQGAAFCEKCGAKREPPQSAPALSSAATPGDYTPPYAPASIPPEPMRAVRMAIILTGAWLAIILLHSIPGSFVFSSDAMYMLIDILLGIGAYLLLQSQRKCKFYAAGVFLVYAVLFTFNSAAVSAAASNHGFCQNIFKFYSLWPGFGYALLPAAIAACASLLFSFVLHITPDRKRVYSAGWTAAGGLLVYYTLRTLLSYSGYMNSVGPQVFFMAFLRNSFGAATVGFTVIVLFSLCNQKSRTLRLSGWAKAWCILCGLAMLLSVASVFSSESAYWIQLLFPIAAATGFILLLCGKRSGFYTVVIAAFLYLTAMFQTSLQYVLLGSASHALQLISSFLGAANPVITWLLIRRSWQNSALPSGTYAAQPDKNIKAFSKLAVIFDLAMGAFLLLIPFPFIFTDGFVPSMLAAILPGAAIVGLAIWDAVSLFGKRSVYRRGLDILMRVLFFLLCVLLLVILLALLSVALS